jgi:hypothetical protein
MCNHEQEFFVVGRCAAFQFCGRALGFGPLNDLLDLFNCHGFSVVTSGSRSLDAGFGLDAFDKALYFWSTRRTSTDSVGVFLIGIYSGILSARSGNLLSVEEMFK